MSSPSSCLPEDTGAKHKSKTEPFTYVIGLLAYTGTREITVVDGKIDTTVHKADDGSVLVPGSFTETAGILPVPAQSITAGGGGGGTGDASNAKLDQVITAINSTTEDDQTQTLLSTLITESNDTQTLVASLQTAIDGATDETVVTALSGLLTALQDTTEDDQTQAGIASVLTEIGDEGDETQTALGLLQTGLTTLATQNQAEDDQTQLILTAIFNKIDNVSGTQAHYASGILTADTTTTFSRVKSYLIRNTGATDIHVDGTPVLSGEDWTAKADTFNFLENIDINVDPSVGAVNQYHIDAWTLPIAAPPP